MHDVYEIANHWWMQLLKISYSFIIVNPINDNSAVCLSIRSRRLAEISAKTYYLDTGVREAVVGDSGFEAQSDWSCLVQKIYRCEHRRYILVTCSVLG